MLANGDGHMGTHPTGQRGRGPSGQGQLVSAWLVVLLVFAGIAAFSGLDAGPSLSDHEAIVAQTACEIRRSGAWLIPTFNDVPFIRKPPLQPWLAAAASYVLDPRGQDPPVSVLASRCPSAVAALLTVLVVFALGRSMFGARVGLVAGGIMACCGGTLFYSHNAQTEMLLTFFTAAAMACFHTAMTRTEARRRYLIGFYVCLALAMLAKAPLPLVLVGLPLAVYWFVTVPIAEASEGTGWVGRVRSAVTDGVPRQLRAFRGLWLVPGLLVLLGLFLPWPVYVYFNVDHALQLWRTEFIDRYTGQLSDEGKPVWYYLPLVFALTAPFCLSIPDAFAAPFRRAFRRDRSGLLFVLTWVVVQIAFLSSSAFKRPHYMMPALPGLCLLLAPVIDRLFMRTVRINRGRVKMAIVGICGFMVIGAVVAIVLTEREVPSITWATWHAAGILLAGIGLASYLFWVGRRQVSLIVLYVIPVLMFAWLWSALGRSEFGRGEALFAERFKALAIGPDAPITWAIGRPDARVSYYLGITIQPLYTPMELAARRRGRRGVPEDIIAEGARRIADRLASSRVEYFIFEADELYMFGSLVIDGRSLRERYIEVLRVETDPSDRGEALVVITNKWNQGTRVGRPATCMATGQVRDDVSTVGEPLPTSADVTRQDCQ
jgi:4-amino-4-deoxy-L-arabinose transferase-like glycosyltransferase